jgi:PAS domain S-box-containing protein
MSDNIFIQPVKIAVIDDNIDFGLGVKLLLAKEGVEVSTAANGLEGLELVNQLLPDIVLLDVVMPGLDGIEVCKKIRQSPVLKGAYIVMLSGLKTQSDQMAEGLEAGADDYITRPLPNRELLARLRSFIRLKNAEKSLKESEDRLSKILQAANDGMWDWDLKTNQVFFDPRYYQMSGYDVDEFPHELNEFQKRVHAGDIDYVMGEAEKHLKRKIDRFDVKFRFLKKSGDWQWIQGKGIIVERNEKGVPQRFVGTHRDISEIKQSEEDLRKSEENLAITLNSIGDGVISTDIDGLIVKMNPIAEKLCGWKLNDALGKPLSEVFKIINDETRETVNDPVQKVLESGEIVGLANHTVLISRNGNEYQIADSAAPIKNKEGKTTGVVLVFSDVTAKYAIQKQIKESEQLFKQVFESSNVGKSITLPSGEINVNQAFCEMLGYSRDELRSKKWQDLTPPEEVPGILKIITALLDGEKTEARFNKSYLHKNGTRVWADVSAALLRDEQGNPLHFITTVIDITERVHALEALRESEIQYRNLANSGAVMIWTSGLDKLCNYFNDPWLKFTGRTLEQEMGNGWAKGVHPDDFDRCLETYVTAFDKTEAFEMEYRLLHSSGEYRWILDIGTPNFNSRGEFVGYIGHCFDISERKTSDQLLKESEERFKALHNASFGGIAIHDKGLILECNHGLSEMTGFSLDELIGMNGLLLIAPEYRDMVMENILAGYEKPYEAVGLRKNGELYPIRLEARNIPYKGKAVRTVEFRDITESKRTQEALQRIEWMLSKKSAAVKSVQAPLYGDLSELNTKRLILDALGKNVLEDIADDFLRLLESSLAIYEKNGDYALGIYTSGYCRYMDQASRALCNSNDNKEALESGKWLCHESCWENASQKAIASGKPVDTECEGGIRLFALPVVAGDEIIGAICFGYGDPPQDKKKLSLLAERFSVPPDELQIKAREYLSRPPYIIDLAKDRMKASANLIGEIVRRKTVEKEILKLNEELEERIIERTVQLESSNKELEAFSYSVSHDLRAPLRHINGFVELMKEEFHDGMPEKAKYYLSNVSDATMKMGKLIEDLLQFSRTGRKDVQKTKIEMYELVNEVVESIKASSPNRLMNWHIQPLPQVFGDYSLLNMVWTNLLDNAAKFTLNREPAEIYIGFGEEKKTFVFFVRDNGVGFEMKYAHKLFGVFQRLHSLDEFEGTGIGLAHVQRIIHKHNGQVWAEAEPGKGATFFFSLPKNKQ